MYDLEPRSKEAFSYAAAHGVNTVIYQSSPSAENEILELLNAAWASGIRLMFTPHGLKNESEAELQLWKHNVENIFTGKVLAHPGFFGYYYDDEPQWRGIAADTVKTGYEYLKQRDPYHPVFTCEAPRGTVDELKDYVAVCDISGADIYPVPWPNSHSDLEDKSPSCVGKYAKKMCTAVDNGKPVWMVLQGFSWGDLTGQGKAVYPSENETRFMAFDAMLNGADSVFYWGCNAVKNPFFHDVLFRTTKELRSLSFLFLHGKKTENLLQISDARIKAGVYEYNGKKYLIAINTVNQPVTVEFKGSFRNLKTIPENQDVSIAGDTFKADFSPWAVQVFGEDGLPPDSSVSGTEKKPSPFYENLKHYLGSAAYQGNAKWIWEESLASSAASKAYFTKKFYVKPGLRQAELHLAADDKAEVFCNGNDLGQVSGHSFMKKFPLEKYLKSGWNTLYIAAADAGVLPCGLLGEIRMKYQEGTAETIVTDEQWMSSSSDSGSDSDWRPAKMIAPFGEGAWGKNIRWNP